MQVAYHVYAVNIPRKYVQVTNQSPLGLVCLQRGKANALEKKTCQQPLSQRYLRFFVKIINLKNLKGGAPPKKKNSTGGM